MAQMTAPEKNALRKAIRLLDNKQHKGDPTYDEQCAQIAAQIREMLLPTEQYNILVAEDCPVRLQVVHYEIDASGVRHLFCSWKKAEKEKKQGGAS